jgi:lipoprotein-anchoring transpeptidase ErfK/SrfK
MFMTEPDALSRLLGAPASRRDFLKLIGPTALGTALLPGVNAIRNPNFAAVREDVPTQGRVTDNNTGLFQNPSIFSKRIKTYYKDIILPISGVTVGDDEDSYNRVWYQVNADGYVPSGKVQPVGVKLNDPDFTILPEGRLATVTVPFTDAVDDPAKPGTVIYRLYYGTTYWVVEALMDDARQAWYKLRDDYYKERFYYVNARHLYLYTPDEIAPISPNIPRDQKRIEVLLGDQVAIAYEKDQPVFVSRVATGAEWKHGVFYTPPGRHYIHHKRPSRHMTSGSPENPVGYDLPGVPWVSYINDKGISFHGTYWHNDFGHPRSHGCINLPITSAQWIFRWTQPVVSFGEDLVWTDPGTRVDIF